MELISAILEVACSGWTPPLLRDRALGPLQLSLKSYLLKSASVSFMEEEQLLVFFGRLWCFVLAEPLTDPASPNRPFLEIYVVLNALLSTMTCSFFELDAPIFD